MRIKLLEILKLKHREFICTSDPVPELDIVEHAEFFLNFQKAILLSLEDRKLLTALQRVRCVDELERQYAEQRKKQHHN